MLVAEHPFPTKSTAAAVAIASEVVDDSAPFYAPVASDLIDSLLGQYQQMRTRVVDVAKIVSGELYGGAMHYFLEGNRERGDRFYGSPASLFRVEGAIAALNASYWSKTLAMTDVLDCMPQKRRDEWNKMVTEMTTPDFTEEAVRPTISGLLSSRHQFMAERVDGIFRSLSHDHVTNVPEGFSKIMILNRVVDCYGFTNHTQAGHINDLRAVIAKFMGRDSPRWDNSSGIVQKAKNKPGKWVSLDGGAVQLKVFKKGTAHLLVHPDMAYRLNQVLAHLYPTAIPSQFRSKPKKQPKAYQLISHLLPFSVLKVLDDLRMDKDRRTLYLSNTSTHDKTSIAEATRVLESIGGVKAGGYQFKFDYDPGSVISEITSSGCIPDQKSHQYYSTPEIIGAVAVDMADIGDDDTFLEPSAGQGGLAALLPKDRTTCVEISALHCDILRARGFKTINADFLEWAKSAPRFSRILMNPPFSLGRAEAHVAAAADLVTSGGRLTAVLPASLKGKDILPGWDCDWSRVFSDEFEGTSVSVIIVSGVKP